MKIILLITFIVLLSGCGKKDQYNKQLSLAFGTEEIVAKFQRESKTLGSPIVIDNLIIELVDSLPSQKGSMTLGICESERGYEKTDLFGNKTIVHEAPRILVLKSYFNSVTQAAKEVLLFHELGHCVLNLNHIDGYDANKFRYYSIMRSVIIDSSNYITNYDYYQKQLFGKIKVNGDSGDYNFVYMTYSPAISSLSFESEYDLRADSSVEDSHLENSHSHCIHTQWKY